MKNLFAFAFFLIVGFFLFTSCQKDVSQEELHKEITTKISKNTSSNSIIDFVKYYNQYDEDSLFAVSIGHKAGFFFISKSNQRAQEMLDIISTSNESVMPLKVSLENNEVVRIELPTDDERAIFEESILLIPNNQPVSASSRSSNSINFYNTAQVQEVFDYLESQDCENNFTNIYPCIPFKYKRDGCYARAHKMKEVMESVFNKSCDKIFVWGKLRNGCSVYRRWYYHVAPIVYVGNRGYVIDPGLNKYRPLTIAEWKRAMIPNRNYYINKTVITNGSYYMPRDQYNDSSGYHTDYNTYGIRSHMNNTLLGDANLGSCGF